MDNRPFLSDQFQQRDESKHNCTSNMLKFFDFHKNLQSQVVNFQFLIYSILHLKSIF